MFSLICSKKLFSTVHNFVHLNMAIALFVGYLIFAVGVELAKGNEVGYCRGSLYVSQIGTIHQL